MGIIETFVRRRVLTTVLVLIAIILGILSYVRLGVRRFPSVEFPVVTVITRYQGGSPPEIETEISKRVEDAVSSLSDIETIQSFSQQGISQVIVEFDLGVDLDIKAVDVRNEVDKIVNALPEDADNPIVEKFEFSEMPIVTLALSGPQDVNELYRIADEDLSALLSQVSGVADVQLTGGQVREIHVLLDGRKLRKHRISAGMVTAALQATNRDVPSGHITQPGREYTLRVTGRFETVTGIEGVRVPTPGEAILTVGDLGEVRDTYEEKRTASRFDGREAVTMGIQPRSDANEVEVADAVKAMFPELDRYLPPGAQIDIAEDTSRFVRGALRNVEVNMAIGIFLTSVVLYLFLKSWRATFIAAVAMPTALIVAFVGMAGSGFTLNIVSLLGLAIVIGVLVNNAILILENVTRFIERGEDPMEAAVKGSNQIAIAIISSTATNLVVFLPVAFMGEIIGQFFKQLGLTVVYATTVSLLVSFSLTPMLSGLLMKRKDAAGEGRLARLWNHSFGYVPDLWRAGFERVKGGYLRGVDWCLDHRFTALLMVFVLFLGCTGLLLVVGFEFMPTTDEGQFRVTLQMPVGTPLQETDAAMRRIEQQVRQVPHLEHYYARVGQVSGQLGGASQGVNLGETSVTVTDRDRRQMSVDDITNWLRPRLAEIPSAQIDVTRQARGPGGDPVAVEIRGDDLKQLQQVADRVVRILQVTPGAAGVGKSWQAGQPELRLEPIQEAVNRHGLNVGPLALEVRSYIEGREAGEFRDRDENYDIMVKMQERDRDWVEEVGDMFVSSPATGQMLRLNQVARIHKEAGPTLITRKDRRRMITVSSGLTGGRTLSEVKQEVERRIAQEIDLPPGFDVQFGGEFEAIQENFPELFKAMATAAALTFLCVAGIIESFGFAVVIIMALPVCLIGVAVAMLLGGVTINIFSLMGMIILVGMVVNNAIIMVDYAGRRESEGAGIRDAIFAACRERFRMIIMANLTTVVALIPLALGYGFGGEIFRPLAVVQMGGVLAAALLSLMVIPVLYVILRRRGARAGAV
ncbi:MAG: efflux RND transporter permease subunit [Planctomycetota bacterium]